MVEVEKTDTSSAEFSVVGIGSSAGGITALQTLFRSIPPTTPIAFVVVQHLATDRPNQLVRLFGAWTALPVREATDGVVLEPGCIFVAPPAHSLILERGVFATRPLDGTGARAGIDTIDCFFESLALHSGPRATAVVLSGTGADGAAGVVRIKQAGGRVLVQAPVTAMHDGMPTAAIASGAADLVLPLGSLAEELVAGASPSATRLTTVWPEDVNEALAGIVELIRTKAGFDLTGYKTTPLVWRIQHRMEMRRLASFRDYETLLQGSPAELEALIRGIPIHVTKFFRDEQAWNVLEHTVIPELFRHAGGTPVRAWTPACSTGEEAYSVAMLLAEHASTLDEPADFQVFATDVSHEVVSRAGRGIFNSTTSSGLSSERRHRFFNAADGAWSVKRELRQKMVFAPQDLLADPPITSLDLVTCRNLLIYLDQDASARVVHLLQCGLRLGGYLFLGNGESLLSTQRGGFRELPPSTRIYRKTGHSTNVGISFPKRPARLSNSRSNRSSVEAYAHEAALEELDLPAVIVDEQFQILRIHGDTGPFLRFKPGEPTLNLLRLLPPATHLDVAAQMLSLREGAVTIGRIADPATGEFTVSLRLTRLPTPEGASPKLLVSFIRGSKAAAVGAGRESTTHAPGTAGSFDAREALRLTHEELEASREELHALNEELRASNDQLNLANDDLSQVNDRLRDKIDELETQSDVLSSGEVMALFLDEGLNIRWFTPGMSELFPVKGSDTGRSIAELVPRFDDPTFLPDVRSVMTTGEPREGEVQTGDGRWYLRRIRPFHTGGADGPGAGVAITFTDITVRKIMEAALRQSESVLAVDLEAMTRLHEFSSATPGARNVTALLDLALDAIIGLHRADFGNVQLYDEETGALLIAAHRGFDPTFLDHFAQVDARDESACGKALASRKRVVFEDVEKEDVGPLFRAAASRAGYRAVQSTPLETGAAALLGVISTHFRQPRVFTASEHRVTDILANELAIAIERLRASDVLRESERVLQRNKAWLTAQMEAFQSAMDGASLTSTLGILIRAAVDEASADCRCAFYIVEAAGKGLRHVVGMDETYAKRVDGCVTSPESLACGLALATGEPVVTPDVLEEPRWQPWTWLAREYDYRACWSFPVETSTGKLVGSVAMYFKDPRKPTPRDLELAASMTRTAAMIIFRHQAAEERGNAAN